MNGETDLKKLVQEMKPELNPGEFVFCTLKSIDHISSEAVLGQLREKEGFTLILEKSKADELGLPYEFVASWITLSVHSDLNSVGLTATFSKVLAQHEISCNVISGYYHDHIFVPKKDGSKATAVLKEFSKKYNTK